MVICWNFSKQEADASFLDREKRGKFVARYTSPAADAVTDMGFKEGIIQFGILRFWNELHDAFYDVKTGVKFFFKVVNVVFPSQLIIYDNS